MRPVALILPLVFVVGLSNPAAGQFPGDHLNGGNRARTEFLTSTLQSVSPVLTKWKEAMESDDSRRAADFFLEDGLFSSFRGEIVQGRGAIAEAFAKVLPRMSGFRTSMVDYTASGNMVYQFGRFSYTWTSEDNLPRTQSGTFVLVLYQSGRDWKIRSYVERVEHGT